MSRGDQIQSTVAVEVSLIGDVSIPDPRQFAQFERAMRGLSQPRPLGPAYPEELARTSLLGADERETKMIGERLRPDAAKSRPPSSL
jgi:hypothetical protein